MGPGKGDWRARVEEFVGAVLFALVALAIITIPAWLVPILEVFLGSD